MSEETEPIAQPQPAACPPAETTSYKKVVKNTAVYGSSQVVQMLVTLIRAKFVAVLLGAFGMGVNALLLSAVMMIQQFSAFGIFQSGIRELSQANSCGDAGRLSRMRRIFGRLTWATGLLGALLCLALSPLLSRLSFGDGSYTYSFMALALALPFMAVFNGKAAVMQATQHLGLLAKATVAGTVASLAVALPLFYFLRLNGIVPAILANYAVWALVNRHFERRIPFEAHPAPSLAETVQESRPILKLGAVLMLSQLLMVSFTFLLNSFIRHFGSVDQVGFFQAASSICVQSMVVITMTLSADYFPRLSAIHDKHDQLVRAVDQQAEIVTLLLVPISIVLIVAAPWIVRLLLSPEYEVIVPLLRTMSLAFIFRGIWNVVGFVALAKGDRRTYFIYDALTGHGLNFLLNLAGFYFFGLYGLGISYVAGSLYMSIRLSRVVGSRYGVWLSRATVLRLVGLCLTLLALYLGAEYLSGWAGRVIVLAAGSAVIFYCLRSLDARIGLWRLLCDKCKK